MEDGKDCHHLVSLPTAVWLVSDLKHFKDCSWPLMLGVGIFCLSMTTKPLDVRTLACTLAAGLWVKQMTPEVALQTQSLKNNPGYVKK